MKKLLCLLISFLGISSVQSQILPEEIQFKRQGAQRLIFDEEQSITMAKLEPKNRFLLSNYLKSCLCELDPFVCLTNKFFIYMSAYL